MLHDRHPALRRRHTRRRPGRHRYSTLSSHETTPLYGDRNVGDVLCAGVLFSVMAGTMVAGMPLGAWFTNNFQYERIIVPAGLLSCGAFAGIGLSDSYVFPSVTELAALILHYSDRATIRWTDCVACLSLKCVRVPAGTRCFTAASSPTAWPLPSSTRHREPSLLSSHPWRSVGRRRGSGGNRRTSCRWRGRWGWACSRT